MTDGEATLCYFAECRLLFSFMPNAIMLSVVMLNVILLSVMRPSETTQTICKTIAWVKLLRSTCQGYKAFLSVIYKFSQ
jgi:hypothetical protein